MIILLFLVPYVVSYHRRWFISQNPFLVTTVRFSSEKLRLDDVEESSFTKGLSTMFMEK